MSNEELPVFTEAVSCGFPSPAQGYIEQTIDLNKHFISRPAATFFVRVSGDSMKDIGIHNGDLLIVDRSITAVHGHIVVASINGGFTVKELCTKPIPQLIAHNVNYPPILINENSDFTLFGVVAHVIKTMRRKGV